MWLTLFQQIGWPLCLVLTLLATCLGIRSARSMTPIGRGEYLLFVIGAPTLVGLALAALALVFAILKVSDAFSAAAIPLIPAAYYFFARATARRLLDIGWSPHWSWLLLPGYVLVTLVLLFVPGRRLRTVSA